MSAIQQVLLAAGASVVAPANTALPVISGTTIVGQTLTTSNGTWTGSPTFTYQWLRGGSNISGATASSYLLVTADLSATITATVTATNAGGSTGATSAGVGPITTVWSPASLTGLIGWWDTSVTASMTLSGSNITAIADQSGLGNTLTATSVDPIYSATGFNSGTKPAMLMQANGPLRSGVSTFPMGTGNTLTAWSVTTMANSGTLSGGRYFSFGDASHTDFNYAQCWMLAANGSSTTSCEVYRNSTQIQSAAVAAYPAPHRIIMTVKSDGTITIYIDGVSSGTGTSGGNWLGNGTLRIGTDTGGSSFLVAPIAECGIATGYSDATTVGQLDTFLKTKWGL